MEEIINNNIVNSTNAVILEKLNNSMELLIKWSGKQNHHIIFDSDLDGDGKGVLEYTVLNKKNLYFISFDIQNNVFGGYVNELISKKRSDIKDSNAFVFSLIRNGKVKNIKYNIKKGEEKFAFLCSNFDNLYLFGHHTQSGIYDVLGPKIGFKCCWESKPNLYQYNGEKRPIRDATINNFIMKRILVVEMS